jgi:hypothetical protein
MNPHNNDNKKLDKIVMKVGAGDEQWDNMWNSSQEQTITKDIDEAEKLCEELITTYEIKPIDIGLGNIEEVGGSSLKFKVTLETDIPSIPEGKKTYPLREFGLFGILNNESSYMINCVRHPVIHKGANTILIREVTLEFSAKD